MGVVKFGRAVTGSGRPGSSPPPDAAWGARVVSTHTISCSAWREIRCHTNAPNSIVSRSRTEADSHSKAVQNKNKGTAVSGALDRYIIKTVDFFYPSLA